MLPGGTWRRQNSRRSFGLLSPKFKLSQADFPAGFLLVYLTDVFHGTWNEQLLTTKVSCVWKSNILLPKFKCRRVRKSLNVTEAISK